MHTVYITAPSDAASDIAHTLVEERLAACVNRFDCSSVYRWEGEVLEDDEIILLAKTTEETADQLLERVAELHPYDVPCIEQFAADSVHPPFATWCAEETGG